MGKWRVTLAIKWVEIKGILRNTKDKDLGEGDFYHQRVWSDRWEEKHGSVSRLKTGVLRSTGRSMMPKDTERSSPVRMNESLLNLAT